MGGGFGVGDLGIAVAAGRFVAVADATAEISVGAGPIIVGVSVGTATVGLKLGRIVKVGRGVLVRVAVGLERARKSVIFPASQASRTSPSMTTFRMTTARFLLNDSSP